MCELLSLFKDTKNTINNKYVIDGMMFIDSVLRQNKRDYMLRKLSKEIEKKF